MSEVDVRQLNDQQLPAAPFPVDPQQDFRCYFDPDVHRGIEEHAQNDVSVEICGVLVGHLQRDEHGPFVRIENYIRCDQAASKFAEVTFTHESWAQINAEMDTRFSDARIVGWYHSHPDFGIFLSERDGFIQQHFFSGPGQVAYVVDPVRNAEGVFAWRHGKTELLSQYWVGDEVRTVAASRAAAPPTPAENVRTQDERPVASPPLSTTSLLLAGLALLLFGYVSAGWRSAWEQEKILEGAVAHYGVHKLLKHNLELHLAELSARVRRIRSELARVESPDAPTSAAASAERTKAIDSELRRLEASLATISQTYGYAPAERAALAELMIERLDALTADRQRGAPPRPLEGNRPSQTPAAAGEPGGPSPKGPPGPPPAEPPDETSGPNDTRPAPTATDREE